MIITHDSFIDTITENWSNFQPKMIVMCVFSFLFPLSPTQINFSNCHYHWNCKRMIQIRRTATTMDWMDSLQPKPIQRQNERYTYLIASKVYFNRVIITVTVSIIAIIIIMTKSINIIIVLKNQRTKPMQSIKIHWNSVIVIKRMRIPCRMIANEMNIMWCIQMIWTVTRATVRPVKYKTWHEF